ncbi:MAG: zinc ribbon domain-containing protein [Kiritimatiellae bacterium]|nr:zinc ribbon domain-containing protein [Kiritimatiellia bacterium]
MPTYEYECQKCRWHFEKFQSMTAEPVKRCPKCRGKVKRLIGTGAGIIFKGSGFYETDYRSESYKKAAKEESGKSVAETGKSNEKKDKKKETTPDKKAAGVC